MSKTSLEIALRRQLGRLVSGSLAIDESVQWFAARLGQVQGRQTLEELAYEVALRVAEFSNGDWTEGELRHLLRPLVSTYRVTMNAQPGVSVVQLGSSTTTINPQLTSQVAFAVQAP